MREELDVEREHMNKSNLKAIKEQVNSVHMLPVPMEVTEVYSHSAPPDLPKEQIIDAKKNIARAEKSIRQTIKRDVCLICKRSVSSFCSSHSIPRFVLENIADQGYVSALEQANSLEPNKNTGVGSAGVFANICRECDNTEFQSYEEESAFSFQPTDEMLAKIATKNNLKWIHKSLVDAEGEKLFTSKIAIPQIIKRGDMTTYEHDLREFQHELEYALKTASYHLYYYKKLDYVIPFAAQYTIAMLEDLSGNLINDIYNPSKEYRLEYLHVAIFPLSDSSVILLFTKEGETRHRRFFRQLRKLDEMDQLSTINYLTFSGTDNVFINPTVYAKLIQNPDFLAVCRMTYSIQSNIPRPQSLKIAMQAHSFDNRKAFPNLLSPEYALKTISKA